MKTEGSTTMNQALKYLKANPDIKSLWAIASTDPGAHSISCGVPSYTTMESVLEACRVYNRNSGLKHKPVLVRVLIRNRWLRVQDAGAVFTFWRFGFRWPFIQCRQIKVNYEQTKQQWPDALRAAERATVDSITRKASQQNAGV